MILAGAQTITDAWVVMIITIALALFVTAVVFLILWLACRDEVDHLEKLSGSGEDLDGE